MTLVDGGELDGLYGSSSLAWSVLGFLEDVPEPTAAQRDALSHLRAGRWASAWISLEAQS